MRNVVINIIAKQKDWKMDIINFLKSKKAALRDLAVSIMAKQGTKNYSSELETAFETEKSEKLKTRIASLLNINYGEKVSEEAETVDMVTELTKNNKNKKVAWLFKEPYKPVRLINGETARRQAFAGFTPLLLRKRRRYKPRKRHCRGYAQQR